jgi:hypothetical protein
MLMFFLLTEGFILSLYKWSYASQISIGEKLMKIHQLFKVLGSNQPYTYKIIKINAMSLFTTLC